MRRFNFFAMLHLIHARKISRTPTFHLTGIMLAGLAVRTGCF
jgi:hypothetical protein